MVFRPLEPQKVPRHIISDDQLDEPVLLKNQETSFSPVRLFFEPEVTVEVETPGQLSDIQHVVVLTDTVKVSGLLECLPYTYETIGKVNIDLPPPKLIGEPSQGTTAGQLEGESEGYEPAQTEAFTPLSVDVVRGVGAESGLKDIVVLSFPVLSSSLITPVARAVVAAFQGKQFILVGHCALEVDPVGLLATEDFPIASSITDEVKPLTPPRFVTGVCGAFLTQMKKLNQRAFLLALDSEGPLGYERITRSDALTYALSVLCLLLQFDGSLLKKQGLKRIDNRDNTTGSLYL